MSHLSLSKNVKTGPEVQKDANSTSLLESKAVHGIKRFQAQRKKRQQANGVVTGLKEQEFKEEEAPGVTLVMDQKIVQETMQSILLKEAKPKQYQGKTLESQKRMKADFLYLGPDYTVSRSKPCQEGGDDVVIRSATEPERFSSPSICEYSTLEGDLSSSKEQPEAKPIIGVKRSLSDFQKAQDHEKWPRNYEVMIQSPKPVNRVLHLPQLEANRFNQLQTRHWRPGDLFNQSGDILGVQEEFCKFIPCTSNHWIRRILIYSNLPYLEQTDINVQKLFSLQIRHEIRTYHAPRKIVQETMQSILLKEAKPKQYQGKALESQKRMKADLLYLGEDYTVLRSKPCQEGGDDVVIRSATEPERFSSSSIFEYPTLEGDLTSSKERNESKPIIGVKRSLSAFQKAQYQKIFSRNYEVMIQSPKPVNPVLHLPQLEANRFNQLQTRHWRPGDHFNQSGDILGVQEEFCKFMSCTRNHWIMRILIYSNLPYLEQTDINVQQLFSLQIRHEIRTYQAPRKFPRKLSYPLKPSRFKKNQVSHLEPKSHKRLQRIVQETMQSILLKEAKPKQYQGKALESQKRMKADLLYLGAYYTVLRSKPCQEGGDDVVIRSATEPEVNPKPYSTSQGAKQNTCALKIPYLTKQEGLSHKTNFNGL
ncbi:hypothetical protein F2Q69_00040745 [Brassica cretica]|uniref:Uncharacterized protein n=1 Tax=Brassica cretica TaxID=69181 RepID=A0A8S9NMC3_BRACR|nr:hypothetical protein F2Q69_00040745 [Brassica cretica]